MGTLFQVQFCIHLLVDVLTELNKLSQQFQEEHIDITSIGTQLDVLIEHLRRRYLRNIFGAGSQHVSYFLKKFENGNLEYIDKLDNKIYSWLGKYAKRHGKFKSLLDLFQIDRLQVLQIHQI